MKLNFTNTSNTRDLGGLCISLGKWTKSNRIIRSDVPITLSETEIKYLINNEITTIIDLRDIKHTELSPTILQKHSGFNWHNVPLQVQHRKIEGEDDLIGAYMDFTFNYQGMKRIFEIIGKAEHGIFIHCQEGKDRTGIVVAILLMAVGVQYEDIVLDYHSSQIYMQKYIKKVLDAFPDFPAYRYASKPEYIEKYIDCFCKKFGTAKKYFQRIGLDSTYIEHIQEKLI